jgi:hypothetical protein
MITNAENVVHRKVPFLGDIPLLGRLFRYDLNQHNRKELLVFLTPVVLNDEASQLHLQDEINHTPITPVAREYLDRWEQNRNQPASYPQPTSDTCAPTQFDSAIAIAGGVSPNFHQEQLLPPHSVTPIGPQSVPPMPIVEHTHGHPTSISYPIYQQNGDRPQNVLQPAYIQQQPFNVQQSNALSLNANPSSVELQINSPMTAPSDTILPSNPSQTSNQTLNNSTSEPKTIRLPPVNR